MDALATFQLPGKTSDVCILIGHVFVHVHVGSFQFSPVLQNVHFRLPVDTPDDDGRLISWVFHHLNVTCRDLPFVDGDASTPEEAHDLIFHILKVFLRSCVRRFSCIRMCSRTRIRGVSHTQPTDDVVNLGVLLELIDTSFEYRNLLVFSIIMLFSSILACFNSLVIAFF